MPLPASGGKKLAGILGGTFVNEVIAQARGTFHFNPETRAIIDMGGEDAKLIMVTDEEGHLVIQDFAMNTMCAAGTGSFLDQQAHRLGYSIEEFSQQSLKSTTPPRIAGRCSVFAKTDMIHLQQGATPDYEIIYGLCLAMARNLKSNIAKGKTLTPPVAFQGGVAANLGVRRAFPRFWNWTATTSSSRTTFAPGRDGGRGHQPGKERENFSLSLEPLRAHLAQEAETAHRLPPLSPPPLLGPESYAGWSPRRAWRSRAISASMWAPSAPTWWSSTGRCGSCPNSTS